MVIAQYCIFKQIHYYKQKAICANFCKGHGEYGILTSPFARVLAKSQTGDVYYLVFQRTDSYSLEEGSSPNSYEQLIEM